MISSDRKHAFPVPFRCVRSLFVLGSLLLLWPAHAAAQTQPTAFRYTTFWGHAGVGSVTIEVDGGANMLVDLWVELNNDGGSLAVRQLDGNGRWTALLTHWDAVGLYHVTDMKNHNRPDWVGGVGGPLSQPDFLIAPPKPTSFTIAPTNLTAGQSTYSMTVGNGADVVLDWKFHHLGWPEVFVDGWPTLSPAAPSSPDGVVSIPLGPCTWPGDYLFTQVKNHASGAPDAWTSTNQTVTVTSLPPTVSGVTPSSVVRQGVTTNTNVTLSGTNLCGVQVWTGWPGLTFSNIPADENSDGTTTPATFSVTTSAKLGIAPVLLYGNGGWANGGGTALNFTINGVGPNPHIEEVSPGFGTSGTSVPVTIMGWDLSGATLEAIGSDGLPNTNWTFSNVTASANWVNATFNIPSSAAPGSATIQLTTTAGFKRFQFTVNGSAPPGLSTKEYIYLGGRVIALEAQ